MYTLTSWSIFPLQTGHAFTFVLQVTQSPWYPIRKIKTIGTKCPQGTHNISHLLSKHTTHSPPNLALSISASIATVRASDIVSLAFLYFFSNSFSWAIDLSLRCCVSSSASAFNFSFSFFKFSIISSGN